MGMNKIVLGKTKDDLDREEAKKQREKEAEIQNYISERQMKLEALHKKQTKNKMILIAAISVIATSLTFFGVYNTFFKKGITMENDVNPAIRGAVSGLSFPSDGLDNYIRDNCEAMFNKHFNINNNQVDHIYVDKNSCNIRKVNAYSSTMAQVWFSVDVTTVEKDHEITDSYILNQIENINRMTETASSYENNDSKFEFASNEISFNDTLQFTAATKKDPSVDDSSVNDDSSTSKDSKVESKKEDSSSKDNSSEESIVDSMSVDSMPDDTSYGNDSYEDSDVVDSDIIDSDDMNSSNDTMSSEGESSTTTNKTNVIRDNNGNVIEYYYKNNTYYQVGNSITNRYNFVVGIEFFYEYDGDTPVTSGFRPVTDLILYTLNDVDQTDFDKDLTVSPYYEFKEETRLDSNETEKIRVKVDKTLQDLYEMRDVSQDFMNYRTFNTYNAKYVSLDKIDSYSEDDYLGYNTYIEYTILTSQGFTYQIKTYLKVEPSGNSYVITKIL